MIFRVMSVVSAIGLVATPGLGQEDVLIDYNASSALESADPQQWSDIADEIGGDVSVLGEVTGSFTAGGVEQVAYLVSHGAPVAADPFPKLDQRLVIFNGNAEVADWALPEDSAFARPVAATDFDGDGIDEIVVEGSFYNMGTLAIGLSAIKVGEAPEVVQTLPDVYIDSCDASAGQRSIEASVVRVVEGALSAETTTHDCSR